LIFEAEHRMGEMIAETDLNKGAKGSVVTGTNRVPVKDDRPTLADIGITKNESARAQRAVISGKIANMEHGEMGLKVANSSENNQSPNSDTPTTRL